jgi:hypothetical protein
MRLRRLATGLLPVVFGAFVLVGSTAHGSHPGGNGAISFEAFVSFERSVKSVNADGSALSVLTDPDAGTGWFDQHDLGLTTAWSADGSTLAFYADPANGHPLCSQGGAIWSITLPGGAMEALYCPADANSGYYPSSMSWSPDGSRIVLDESGLGWGDPTAISLLDVDTGSVSVLVSEGPNSAFSPSCAFPNEWVKVGSPSWSPLGDRIAFTVSSDFGCPSINGIWTIGPDGSGLQQVTEGSHAVPDWSPDGNKIVFVASSSGPPWLQPQGPIHVVDADGGVPTLVRSGSTNRNPVWSPDGASIAYSVVAAGIYVMDADGGNVALVPNTTDVRRGHISGQAITTPPDPDGDDDGVDDAIQTGSGSFDDGDGTSGSITDANGLTVLVSDADDSEDGVRITVIGSSALKASFTICGFSAKISGDSEVVVSCGSVAVDVVHGAAEIVLGDDVVVSVPDGGRVRVTDDGGTFYTVENLGPTNITIDVDGTETILPAGEDASVSIDTTGPTVECGQASFLLNQPGALVTATVSDGESGPAQSLIGVLVSTASAGSYTVELTGEDLAANETAESCAYSVGYVFTGFFQPIDNVPSVNQAKAGQTIPIKWRIADFFGVGVSDSASFESVTSGGLACEPSAPQDAIETYSGASGLQHQGDGRWQFNWKTPKGYAGQCRIMRLNLTDGVTTRQAGFRFK